MQEMDGSSWKRQGSSIVWSPELLGPLVIENRTKLKEEQGILFDDWNDEE